jgi:3-hydroxyisobutyrate dehydrogenase-like beta-hydroxyacid dehydrogenase
MRKNKEVTVGITHPGAMGISVAATIIRSGFPVHWASEKRSDPSKARAAEHKLIDLGTIAQLVQNCNVLVSVCPPHAAAEVAAAAITHGFQGLYLDANAIAPAKAQQIGRQLADAGSTFVDGGIIGGPAWQPGTTWLYLSGPAAATALPFFAAGPLETEIAGPEIGQASALKMVFAAYTKGRTALLALVLAGAEALDVRPALENQWTRYWPEFTTETHDRLQRVTAKAWRFEGEMQEIADTFAGVDLPPGFHKAAAEIYGRMSPFKDAPELPDLESVLEALRHS